MIVGADLGYLFVVACCLSLLFNAKEEYWESQCGCSCWSTSRHADRSSLTATHVGAFSAKTYDIHCSCMMDNPTVLVL